MNYSNVLILGLLLVLGPWIAIGLFRPLRRVGWQTPVNAGLGVALAIIMIGQVLGIVYDRGPRSLLDVEVDKAEQIQNALTVRLEASTTAYSAAARATVSETSDLEVVRARRERLRISGIEHLDIAAKYSTATKRIAALRSELASMDSGMLRQNVYLVVSAFIVGLLAFAGVAYSERQTRALVETRNALLHSRGSDPLAITDEVRMLIDSGKVLEATAFYRSKTGAWIQDAREAIDKTRFRSKTVNK